METGGYCEDHQWNCWRLVEPAETNGHWWRLWEIICGTADQDRYQTLFAMHLLGREFLLYWGKAQQQFRIDCTCDTVL